MTRVSAACVVPGPVEAAEALWYDLGRWAAFMDGFAHTHSVDDRWPQEGGRLQWDSTPHGRGRVVERVIAYEPQGGQSSEIEDERLRGTQRIEFIADGPAVRVLLTLEYSIKERTPFTPIVDLLFVRRAVRDALRRTLTRFTRERVADDELT